MIDLIVVHSRARITRASIEGFNKFVLKWNLEDAAAGDVGERNWDPVEK